MQGNVNKAAFVRAVGLVLQVAEANVASVALYDEDTALITFEDGSENLVNIARDSRTEIIKDIVEAIL